MLITFNGTRQNGNFMGDQLCYLKIAYLMVQNEPDVDRVIFSASPGNEMDFLWTKFLADPRGDGTIPPAEVIYDHWDAGDWASRWGSWEAWRANRHIEGRPFDHYRELYLRIHGAHRQTVLCGYERGMGRKNIYEYVFYGQEHSPDVCHGADWFDDRLIDHPPHKPTRDVYISPHAKTQGNAVFTFDYWEKVVCRLLEYGISVTVGYNGAFCEDLATHPLYYTHYRKHWGSHYQWMEQICQHRLVACGNTGTGWLACACGVPMITMEPHNSVMADHRYRECGLRNIVEVIDGSKLDVLGNDMNAAADYCAKRISEEIARKVVMTTGCYDILHAGHVRHLQRSRNLGTKLIVALNSDASIRSLKGCKGGVDRPINPQAQRQTVLEALRCVDEVRVFDGPDATDLIREIKPDVLTNGFGYKIEDVVGRDIVEGYGGRVAITCYGDGRDEPSSTKIARKSVRTGEIIDICRAAMSYSVNPFEKLKLLAEQLLMVEDVPGDVADLGTCRGGTAMILRRLAPDKTLHMFDTWEGNPHDDPLCHHGKGEWKASLEECQQLIGNGLPTNYLEGTFPNTAAGLEYNNFCLVYVDMDSYQSTKDAIEFFWPRLVIGGRMVFDDWDWEPCAGVALAIREAFVDDILQIIGHTCIVEKSYERTV